MAIPGILNADMATVQRWIRDGFAWWLNELRDMCPPALLRALQRRWPIAFWNGEQVFTTAGDEPKGRFEVHLPASQALLRRVAMPAMGRRDLEAAIALECDRLMPLPAAELVLALAGASRPPRAADGHVSIAAMERARLANAVGGLALANVVPAALVVEAEGLRFDFLPGARAAGLVALRPSPTLVWWALVALLLMANGVTLIWRDSDSVDRLRSQVEARAPIAQAAQRAAMRLQAGVLVARAQVERRQRQNPLRTLAQVTAALPAEAWIQRWKWDGRQLRISGYARGNLDVVKVLRGSGRFADVRNASSEILAEIPVGHPFDVTIVVGEK